MGRPQGYHHTEVTRQRMRQSAQAKGEGAQHRATVTPSLRDLEWAAGFLEGEGSFVGRGNSLSTTERANAIQVNPDPIIKLQSLFGGRAYRKSAEANNGRQDAWYWYASGPRARGIMMTLFPLMSRRRQQQIREALC